MNSFFMNIMILYVCFLITCSAYISQCMFEQNDRQDICLASQGPLTVENMNRYTQLRTEHCTQSWTYNNLHDDFIYKYFPNTEEYDNLLYSGHPPSNYKREQFAHLVSCTFIENDTYEWSVERVGPFISTGGYDWHDFVYSQSGILWNLLQNTTLFFNAALAAPIYKNGTIIENPPIHIHHTHITTSHQCEVMNYILRHGRNTTAMEDLSFTKALKDDLKSGHQKIEFDIHGDRQCHSEHGGTSCLLRQFPDKYAMMVDRPLCVLGEFNDIRKSQASPLQFYIEYAFRFSRISPKVQFA